MVWRTRLPGFAYSFVLWKTKAGTARIIAMTIRHFPGGAPDRAAPVCGPAQLLADLVGAGPHRTTLLQAVRHRRIDEARFHGHGAGARSSQRMRDALHVKGEAALGRAISIVRLPAAITGYRAGSYQRAVLLPAKEIGRRLAPVNG